MEDGSFQVIREHGFDVEHLEQCPVFEPLPAQRVYMFLAVKQVAYLGYFCHLFEVRNECRQTCVLAERTAFAQFLRHFVVAHHNLADIHIVLDSYGSSQHVVDVHVEGEPLAHELVLALQALFV